MRKSLPLGATESDPVLLHHCCEDLAAGVDEEREQILACCLERCEHGKRDLDGDNGGGSKSDRVYGRVLHGGSFRFWFGDYRHFGDSG